MARAFGSCDRDAGAVCLRLAGMTSGEQVQLTLSFPGRTALGRSDFLVSDSNAAAMGWIDRWPDWPANTLVVHGQPSCGKTHLAHLWCERASAVILSGATLDEEMVAHFVAHRWHRIAVDDAEQAPEAPLLHLYNWCWQCRGSLLLTSRRPPLRWPIELEDLGSRLRAALSVEIGPPDDALLGAILIKHFADRQIIVAPELIAYLTRRIERSFAAAVDVAGRLDAAAWREKSPITVAFARDVLAQNGDQSSSPVSDAGVT